MRQIGLTDLYHAARAVQAIPEPARAQACAQLLRQAHAADKYVKRLRKLHPEWGDGSLRAAALARSCEPRLASMTSDFQACLLLVLSAVMQRRGQDGASDFP